MARSQVPAVGVVRAGLITLALPGTVVGAWLLFLPESFYSDFPGLGLSWVSALPPFNEHLLTDYGSALLGISVVLWIAAVVLERRLVQAALIVQLVQAGPHFVYHLTRFDALPAAESVANQIVLAVPVVVPLLLLFLVRSARGVEPAAAGASR